MASLTRNLKLRLSDDLTIDARFNLERIDQLGSVFPISDSDQTITSSGDIRLEPGTDNVFAPNLQLSGDLIIEAGAFTTRLRTATQAANLTLVLPPDAGSVGQFLSTDGNGTTTWADPPTSNFSTLNDTNFTNLVATEFAQFDGTNWVNVSLPNARQANAFTWEPIDGVVKTITHNFNTSNYTVQIYDTETSNEVFVESLDKSDPNTLVLSARKPLGADYIVHLIQSQ